MIVVDSIHGDVHLSELERRLIDTPSFQRLRNLKQLGMGHVTYPNATHTRFSHSLGVLGVMGRVADVAGQALGLGDEDKENLRLAGLLHDIGHYPYSHLMEGIDKVQLTEEFVESIKTINASSERYPSHEELGELIVTQREDVLEAIGGKERAGIIASLFRGYQIETEQLSRLVHSSLDIDRLDYLLRDAHATGVPYGRIDLNYLLNNLRVSPKGVVGIDLKALPAAEQCLFARFFMYRAVYYHKTTYALEEACRQLLRRLRDQEAAGLAGDGNEIRSIVTSNQFGQFTDAYVDRVVHEAAQSSDEIIQSLANTIGSRRPPRLLKEVPVFEERGSRHHAGSSFRRDCRHRLSDLAKRHSIPLGRFLYCETKPLSVEERGPQMTEHDARHLRPLEKEEIIKVFLLGQQEPTSIVSIPYSIVAACAGHFFRTFRLYLVPDFNTSDERVDALRQEVRNWGEA